MNQDSSMLWKVLIIVFVALIVGYQFGKSKTNKKAGIISQSTKDNQSSEKNEPEDIKESKEVNIKPEK